MLSRVHVLFILMVAMCATVVAVLLSPELPGTQGAPHSHFVAMRQGGDVPLPTQIVLLGWLFGMLQIGAYVTSMTLGVSPLRDSEKAAQGLATRRIWLHILFPVATLLYCGVFTQMMWTDRAAARSGQIPFLGPFPAATSWMLVGMWAAPLLFVIAYLVGFSRWIISDDDLAEFEKLVSRQNSEE